MEGILTEHRAIELSIELWQWLLEHPEVVDKREWPNWEDYRNVNNHCFLCEYKIHQSTTCNTWCPLYSCMIPPSPYVDWIRARSIVEREEAAEGLVRLLWKKLFEIDRAEDERIEADFAALELTRLSHPDGRAGLNIGQENLGEGVTKNMDGIWNTGKVIKTPSGDYQPTTDDLKAELVKAAQFAGLRSFRVKIDGNYVNDAAGLHTNSIAALAADASVESPTGRTEVAEVERYNRAGS